jgi:hypothetical protein
MTPEQAFTVLNALLSKLDSLQQPRRLTAPPPSGDIRRLQQEENLLFESISQAIWTFGNNDSRYTLQEFFDMILSSLTSMSHYSTTLSHPLQKLAPCFFFLCFVSRGAT